LSGRRVAAMPNIAQHIHCVDFFIGSPMLRGGREVSFRA
jgi:hypothetical protein